MFRKKQNKIITKCDRAGPFNRVQLLLDAININADVDVVVAAAAAAAAAAIIHCSNHGGAHSTHN